MVKIRMSDVLSDCLQTVLSRKDVYGVRYITKAAILSLNNGQKLNNVDTETNVQLLPGEGAHIANTFRNKMWMDPGINLCIEGKKYVVIRELEDQTEIHAKCGQSQNLAIGCTDKFVCVVISEDRVQSGNTYNALTHLLKDVKTAEKDFGLD